MTTITTPATTERPEPKERRPESVDRRIASPRRKLRIDFKVYLQNVKVCLLRDIIPHNQKYRRKVGNFVFSGVRFFDLPAGRQASLRMTITGCRGGA